MESASSLNWKIPHPESKFKLAMWTIIGREKLSYEELNLTLKVMWLYKSLPLSETESCYVSQASLEF